MDSYQPEIHISLEDMGYILLGRTVVDMRGVAKNALRRDIPLAFYNEQGGDFVRYFVGRDYQRMVPLGNTDYRIEVLERLVAHTEMEHIDNHSFTTDRVETAPLVRLWSMNLTPPLREKHIRDTINPQLGLPYFTQAYVLNQGKDISKGMELSLRRM